LGARFREFLGTGKASDPAVPNDAQSQNGGDLLAPLDWGEMFAGIGGWRWHGSASETRG